MKIGKLFIAAALLGIMVFTSCGEDGADDPGVNCNTWSLQYADILLDVAAAAEAWDNDQNAQTCQDLVDSYTAAINAMQDFIDEDCIPEAQVAAIETAISTWNTAKNAVDCSSL